MTVLDLIDSCVQRRYAAWAVLKGSARPSAEAVASMRRDVEALARQVRYAGGFPIMGEIAPSDDALELRRQLSGLEGLGETLDGGEAVA